MKHLTGLRLCIYLCIVFAFLSCRKKKSDPPVIEIIKPDMAGDYHIGDTIHVIATVQDDENIKGLTCSVTDQAETPVLAVASFTVNQAFYKIDFYYPINNNEIATGDYNLVIFATDGETDVRKETPIFINEIPRHLKSVFLAASNTINAVNVYKIDTGMIPVLVMNLPGDFSGSGISTRNEQLYIAGKLTGNLNAVSTNTNTIVWAIPNNATGGSAYFTGISCDKERIYVHYYAGKITGYDKFSSQQFLANTDFNSYPVLTLSFFNRLVAIEEFIFGGGKNLVIYNNPGGVPLFVTPVTMDVKALIGKNSTEVYVIGNENGSGKIYVCDITTGQLTLRQQLATYLIQDAALINEYVLLLSTNSGLLEYDYNSNSMVPILPSQKSQLISYDETENEVYVAGGKQLFVYGYQIHNLIPINNFQLQDSILSINLLYNREKF